MKTLVAYLLTICILFSSMGSTILFVHYTINKNYYAKVLCENKNKPMLHCNGKCRLSKELKELEKKADAPFSPLKEKQETVQFFESQDVFSIVLEVQDPKHIAYYQVQTLPEVCFSVFHPPSV